MKIVSKHRVLFGTALVALATVTLYGCKDFLNNAATPQGTLNEGTLANAAGVEGTLIGAYRTLDCTNGTGADAGNEAAIVGKVDIMATGLDASAGQRWRSMLEWSRGVEHDGAAEAFQVFSGGLGRIHDG